MVPPSSGWMNNSALLLEVDIKCIKAPIMVKAIDQVNHHSNCRVNTRTRAPLVLWIRNGWEK